MREPSGDPARSENLCMCGIFMRENREIPRLPSHRERCGPLGEGLRPHARDVRSWEVGLPHSTGEAVEQGAVWLRRWWREGGSARGTRPAQHAPDTEPGQVCQVRWTVCVGSGLMRTGVGPERGAQCGSSARWDLCGGPPERAVPTATAVVREGGGEALTGVRAGRAIEPRNQGVRGADAVK